MTDYELAMQDISNIMNDNTTWVNKEPCRHPGHEFPNMIFIPPGERVEHICPGCGAKSYAIGHGVTM